MDRYEVYRKPGLEESLIAKFKCYEDAKDFAKRELEDEKSYMFYRHQVSFYFIRDSVSGDIKPVR